MDDEPLYEYDEDGVAIILAIHSPSLAEMLLCPFCLWMRGTVIRLYADSEHDFRCTACGTWIRHERLMGALFPDGLPSMDNQHV